MPTVTVADFLQEFEKPLGGEKHPDAIARRTGRTVTADINGQLQCLPASKEESLWDAIGFLKVVDSMVDLDESLFGEAEVRRELDQFR